jgi:hypothetical protein
VRKVRTGTAIFAKYPAAEALFFRTAAHRQLKLQFLGHVRPQRKLKKSLWSIHPGYGDAGILQVGGTLNRSRYQAGGGDSVQVGVKTLADEIKLD